MGVLLGLGRQVFASMPRILLNQWTVVALVAVIVLVFWQHERLARSERTIYGAVKNDPLLQTGLSLVYGTVAGAVTSLLLALTGLAVAVPPGSVSPLPYLWPLALGLALIRPRYLCLAYAVCVLSLSTLVTGWPRIDIASTGALVAVLHLVEGLTVALAATSCASPVAVQGADGQAAAGFVLRRFWPVPMVVPVSFPGAPFALVPFVAGMGYSGLAVRSSSRARAARSGGALVLYGLTLLGLSLLASRWHPAVWLVATFSGAAHEALALWNGRDELARMPFLRRPGRGVGVFDVLPGTVGDAAGLRTGSVILAVGGVEVRTRADVQRAVGNAPAYLEIVFRNGRDLRNCRMPRPPDGAAGLGVILLPEPGDAAQLVVSAHGWSGPHARL